MRGSRRKCPAKGSRRIPRISYVTVSVASPREIKGVSSTRPKSVMASVIPHDDDDSDVDFDEKTAKTTTANDLANDLANDFAAIASSTSATASSGTSTLGLRPRIPEMEFPVDKVKEKLFDYFSRENDRFFSAHTTGGSVSQGRRQSQELENATLSPRRRENQLL